MLHVKWNRDILHFPFPPPDTPLGQLRAELAQYTQLPAGSFKMVYRGGIMREDSAPLSVYKLKEGATITLIGGHVQGGDAPEKPIAPRSAERRQEASRPVTEEGVIGAIRAELERVRETLVPDVDAFVRALAPALGVEATLFEPSAPPPLTPTPLDHTRLSELLLQSLLRLDALHMAGYDWPEARVQRKAAVREVQGVLDQLDAAWAGR